MITKTFTRTSSFISLVAVVALWIIYLYSAINHHENRLIRYPDHQLGIFLPKQLWRSEPGNLLKEGINDNRLFNTTIRDRIFVFPNICIESPPSVALGAMWLNSQTVQ